MKKTGLFLLHTLVFLLLTILTQTGGVIYLLSLWLAPKIKWHFRGKKIAAFVVIYIISVYTFTPMLASLFGRERVAHHHNISPTNYLTVLLNRNYVVPEMNALLANVSEALEGTNITIHYLDANFPFIDGFPLLPHLSHYDGKKLDLSFIYEDEFGQITDLQKSISGYGAFPAEAKLGEAYYVHVCAKKDSWQYSMTRYMTLGSINDELSFSAKGSRKLLEAILDQPQLGKVFIEPYLKKRMGLEEPKIRFHGCGAVRHDDHIHIQLE